MTSNQYNPLEVNPKTMSYGTFVFHSPRFDIFPLDFMLIARELFFAYFFHILRLN